MGYLMFNFGGIKLRYKSKEDKLLKPLYTTVASRARNKKPIIIAMVDGKVSHGGLGDRIHGILSLYLLSKEFGLDFKINFCTPFELKDYFIPNEYDWTILREDISYNVDDSTPAWIYCVNKKYGKSRTYENEYQHKLFQKLLTERHFKQYHFYTNGQWAQRETYTQLFHQLFKPAESLQKAIVENENSIGSDYVAMVFRFQQLLGDFKESNSPDPLNEDERRALIDKCMNKIKSLHTERYPNKKVLVTSDSGNFLKDIDELDFVYVIPGKVVHLAYTIEKNYDLHLKSFIDLMVIADAEKIFLLVTDQMFHSGFAQSASYINNKAYEEITF